MMSYFHEFLIPHDIVIYGCLTYQALGYRSPLAVGAVGSRRYGMGPLHCNFLSHLLEDASFSANLQICS